MAKFLTLLADLRLPSRVLYIRFSLYAVPRDCFGGRLSSLERICFDIWINLTGGSLLGAKYLNLSGLTMNL